MSDRGELDHRTRRGFFMALAETAVSRVHEMCGLPQFKLARIGEWTDEAIGATVPVWRTGSTFRVEAGRLMQTDPDGEDRVVYAFSDDQKRLLARFDGMRSAAEVARDWARSNGLTGEEAFVAVRQLLVPLAKMMVLVPAGLEKPPAGAGGNASQRH